MSLADVIRAWRALRPDDDDERGAIAELLGFRLRPAGPISSRRGPAPRADAPAVPPPPRPESPAAAPDLPRSSIEAIPAKPPPRPAWPALPDPLGPGHLPPDPEPDPIFSAGQLRSILYLLVRSPGPGAPDLVAVVRRLALVRPLVRMPRRSALRVPPGVLLLTERGGLASWLEGPIIALMGALRRVIGGRVRRAALASGVPSSRGVLLAVGTGGAPLGWSEPPTAEEAWIELALGAKRAGVSLRLLVPLAPSALPPAVRRGASVVEWDERTTPSRVARAVGR